MPMRCMPTAAAACATPWIPSSSTTTSPSTRATCLQIFSARCATKCELQRVRPNRSSATTPSPLRAFPVSAVQSRPAIPERAWAGRLPT
eukprot:5460510-Prymnesium_polylepis.4